MVVDYKEYSDVANSLDTISPQILFVVNPNQKCEENVWFGSYLHDPITNIISMNVVGGIFIPS